ncbi:hypothetical protein BDY21DRAFT_345072 [Lineolata rhizophorae]|uniref:Uncharacterized protein n=1 Tax=Lineolata rhizophorae TaxID=578093 RepID=A0A6A6NZG5_9PEZI|nr:hypothetical protein BDY21DRAFT_345072 [Lineolata rhizophorae]
MGVVGPGPNYKRRAHSRNNSASSGVVLTSSKSSTALGLQGLEPQEWRSLWSVGTDAVMDVPLGGVCEVLYGEGRDESDNEDGVGVVADGGDAFLRRG